MMSDIETSESDVSYRVEDAADVSESEEYSSMVDSEALEDSDSESLLSVGGGWSGVNMFEDQRPDPLPPLSQS